MSKTLLQHKWLIVFFTFSASFLMYFSIKNAQFGILSDTNAYLIEKAMLIRLTGHFELAGFVYPPIPFLFALLYPNVLFFAATGTVLWSLLATFLVRDIGLLRINMPVKIMILFVTLFNPYAINLALYNTADVLGLLLIYLSWNSFQVYMKKSLSFHAMISGIYLAIASFSIPIAIYFALIFPLYYAITKTLKQWQESLAISFMIAFPALSAIAIWGYVSWLFTGHPVWGYPSILENHLPFEIPLATLPIFFATSIILLVSRLYRLLSVQMFPLIFLFFLKHNLGSTVLAAGFILLFSLIHLPRFIPLWGKTILVVAIITQAILSLQTKQIKTNWDPKLSKATQVESATAHLLAHAPKNSILTDDRATYSFIARTGTMSPYLLPSSIYFTEIAARPANYVLYVLLSNENGNGLLDRYIEHPPKGMILDAHFSHYTLYRKDAAPPLLYQWITP